MKEQGKGAETPTILRCMLALLATIALLKIIFFPADDEDYTQVTGDFP